MAEIALAEELRTAANMLRAMIDAARADLARSTYYGHVEAATKVARQWRGTTATVDDVLGWCDEPDSVRRALAYVRLLDQGGGDRG